jgi:hypothetical protein
MLAALGLVLSVLILASSGLLVLLSPTTDLVVSPVAVVASVETVVVLMLFVVNGSSLRLLLTLPLSYAFLTWLFRGPPMSLAAHHVPISIAAFLGCFALWAAFAAWYVCTDRIAPRRAARLPTSLRFLRRADATTAGVYLIGEPAWSVLHRLTVTATTAAAITAALWLIKDPIGELEANLALLLSAPVIAMFLAIPTPDQLARRSRSLWVLGSHSRRSVFRVCEHESVRALGWNIIFVALTCLGLAGLLPRTEWTTLTSVLIVSSTTGAFLIYLALMHVEGLKATDVAAALLLVASEFLALGGILSQSPVTGALLVAIAFQLAGAIVCREIAKRRWERIDWKQLPSEKNFRGGLLGSG